MIVCRLWTMKTIGELTTETRARTTTKKRVSKVAVRNRIIASKSKIEFQNVVRIVSNSKEISYNSENDFHW